MKAKLINKPILICAILMFLLIITSTAFARVEASAGGVGEKEKKAYISGGSKLKIDGQGSYNLVNPDGYTSWSMSGSAATLVANPYHTVYVIKGVKDGIVKLTATYGGGKKAYKWVAVGNASLAGYSDDSPVPPQPQIQISPTSIHLKVGETSSAIMGKVLYAENMSTSWEVVNPLGKNKVATLKGKGSKIQVQGNSEGTATLVCKLSDEKTKASIPITVSNNPNENEEIPITGLKISPVTRTMVVGTTGVISPTFEPKDTTEKQLDWSSSDSSVVEVGNGNISAKKIGTAYVYAKSPAGFQAGCEITVVAESSATDEVESIIISGPSSVDKGKKINLTANVQPTTLKDRSVIWSVTPSEVAGINSSTGILEGYKAGTATVTAQSSIDSRKTATHTVKVVDKETNFFMTSSITIDLAKTNVNNSWNIVDANGHVLNKNNFTYSGFTGKIYKKADGSIQASDVGSTVITAKPLPNTSYSGSAVMTVNVINSAATEEELNPRIILIMTSQIDKIIAGDTVTFTSRLENVTNQNDYKKIYKVNDVVVKDPKYKVPEKIDKFTITVIAHNNKTNVDELSDSITINVNDKTPEGIIRESYYCYIGQSNKIIRIKAGDSQNANGDKSKMRWSQDVVNKGEVNIQKLGVGTHVLRGYYEETNELKYIITIVVYDISAPKEITKHPGEQVSLGEVCYFSSNIRDTNERNKWAISLSDGARQESVMISPTQKKNMTAKIYYAGTYTNKSTTVVIEEEDNLILSPTEQTISGGETSKAITATLMGSIKGNEKEITWTASDGLILSASKGKEVTAKLKSDLVINMPTTYTVTAKYGSYSATAKVTVSPGEFKSIQSISYGETKTLLKGKTYSPTVVLDPPNSLIPDGYSIVYSSSKPGVIAVDANGNATAVEVGKATITVKAMKGSTVKSSQSIDLEVIEEEPVADAETIYAYKGSSDKFIQLRTNGEQKLYWNNGNVDTSNTYGIKDGSAVIKGYRDQEKKILICTYNIVVYDVSKVTSSITKNVNETVSVGELLSNIPAGDLSNWTLACQYASINNASTITLGNVSSIDGLKGKTSVKGTITIKYKGSAMSSLGEPSITIKNPITKFEFKQGGTSLEYLYDAPNWEQTDGTYNAKEQLIVEKSPEVVTNIVFSINSDAASLSNGIVSIAKKDGKEYKVVLTAKDTYSGMTTSVTLTIVPVVDPSQNAEMVEKQLLMVKGYNKYTVPEDISKKASRYTKSSIVTRSGGTFTAEKAGYDMITVYDKENYPILYINMEVIEIQLSTKSLTKEVGDSITLQSLISNYDSIPNKNLFSWESILTPDGGKPIIRNDGSTTKVCVGPVSSTSIKIRYGDTQIGTVSLTINAKQNENIKTTSVTLSKSDNKTVSVSDFVDGDTTGYTLTVDSQSSYLKKVDGTTLSLQKTTSSGGTGAKATLKAPDGTKTTVYVHINP